MIDVIGFVGALLLLLAYFMVTTRRWVAFSWPYQAINISAAILLLVYSIEKSAHANVMLNAVFIAVGIFGAYKLLTTKKSTRKK